MKNVILCSFILVTFFVNAQSLSQKITKWKVDQITKNTFPSYFEKGDRKVYCIRMVHVNKPEFYRNVRQTVDSLRNEGYVIFYEGIQLELENKEETELYAKKLRKITHETLLNYYDENNEVEKSHKIEGYVYQNDIDYGLDLNNDILCDLSTKDLVKKYEEDFGEVTLTDCDWNTPMGKKYKCSKKDKNAYNYMISISRNNHLFNEVHKSTFHKIAVIYGKAHIDVLSLMLKNEGWKYVRL